MLAVAAAVVAGEPAGRKVVRRGAEERWEEENGDEEEEERDDVVVSGLKGLPLVNGDGVEGRRPVEGVREGEGEESDASELTGAETEVMGLDDVMDV